MQNALLETEYILFLKNALANTTNAPMDNRQNWYRLRRILFRVVSFHSNLKVPYILTKTDLS